MDGYLLCAVQEDERYEIVSFKNARSKIILEEMEQCVVFFVDMPFGTRALAESPAI